MMPLRFNDMDVVLSELMTEPKTLNVRRTWRERLCSRPWRPLVAVKTITIQVPSEAVRVWNGKVLMHPALFAELRATGVLS